MAVDWLEVITLLGGSGVIVSIATLLYNWRQSVIQREIEDSRETAQRDFEARREAKEYYMKIYGHIAVLSELAKGYNRSIEKGEAEVFAFKECKFSKLSSDEILMNFNEAYDTFSSYYIGRICEGYEIFVSKKLKELLIEFWHYSKTFHDDNKIMKDQKEIASFNKVTDKTTDYMEKLFGLNEVK
jgi:hypothetical protein